LPSAKPKIIMFKQAGCPICEDTLPLVQRLAAHYASCIDTEILDVEQAPELVVKYGVDAVPDLVSFRPDGSPAFRLTGYVDTIQRCQRLYVAVLHTAQSCTVSVLTDRK